MFPSSVLLFILSGFMLIAAHRKRLQSERIRLKIIRVNEVRAHLHQGRNRWSRK